MKKIFKYTFATYLIFFWAIGAMAQGGVNSEHASFDSRFLVQFPIGRSDIDPQYKDNYYAIAELRRFYSTIDMADVDSIRIIGAASPDGSVKFNKALAMRRAEALKELICKQNRISPRKFQLIAKGDTWPEMINLIQRDENFPNKSYTLVVLNLDVPYEDRLSMIKFLKYDESYSHLTNYIYPSLRNALAVVIHYKSDKKFVVYDNKKDFARHEQFISRPEEAPALLDSQAKIVSIADPLEAAAISAFAPRDTIFRRPVLAIKTNLLFDVASLLNLELEVPIGNRWSIMGEVVAPWWLWSDKQMCLQVFSVNLEARLWFGNRQRMSRLTGWFMGAYAGGGYYDVEWDKKGYQGESTMSFGLTVGYAHSIGRSLRMEYSIGVGYVDTRFREYQASQDATGAWNLDRIGDGQKSWIGPTKAKLSLVWVINKKQTTRKFFDY